MIDPGPASAAPCVLQALRGQELAYIFVTHAHLDHAGAAGHVSAAHPEAIVVAHPRAVPHLADPGRLLDGVRAASPGLAPLYGAPLPIPADRLVAADDGEVFRLGSASAVTAVASPGHASHHVAFFEAATGVLFVGDAVGHCGAPIDLPLTVPPRFDVAASRATIQRFASLKPRRLAFAHFGFAEGAAGRLAAYPAEVDAWLAHVGNVCERVGEEGAVDQILQEPRHRDQSASQRGVVRLCVRGAVLTLAALRDSAG